MSALSVARLSGHRRATNPGDEGTLAGTPGHRNAQVTRGIGSSRSDSQADSAGSIPVTRSHVKAQARGCTSDLGPFDSHRTDPVVLSITPDDGPITFTRPDNGALIARFSNLDCRELDPQDAATSLLIATSDFSQAIIVINLVRWAVTPA